MSQTPPLPGNKFWDNPIIAGLFDFKLRRYITRQIGSLIYVVGFLSILVLTPISTLQVYWNTAEKFPSGTFQPILLLVVIGIPLLGVLSLIGLRLMIEFSVAIVNIAENTEKDRRV